MFSCCGASRKAGAKQAKDTEPPKFTQAEMEAQGLKDAFSAYDVNGDGLIQKGELANVLEKFHGKKPTERQLGKIMSKVDLDQNGVIDFPEFKKMMEDRSTTKSDVQKHFEEVDDNKDGFISREELSKLLNSVEPTDEAEIDEILACADADQDGRINFKEFMEFFV